MVCLMAGMMCWVSALSAGNKVSGAKGTKTSEALKVMVVGLPDNVRSNYFPLMMISQETGIPADSVVYVYNNAIAANIIDGNKNDGVEFIMPKNSGEVRAVIQKVSLQGDEALNKSANLSQVSGNEYQQLLADNDADYVLLLNQHYLKWQEKPMQTVFHITSYSLFDKDKNEVIHGNNNFTTMSLEGQEKLYRDARKCSSKILSSVLKTLDR
mgnify:FL=1